MPSIEALRRPRPAWCRKKRRLSLAPPILALNAQSKPESRSDFRGSALAVTGPFFFTRIEPAATAPAFTANKEECWMRDADGDAEDARLLAQVASGDRQAFERLYRIYFPRLTRFLNRMTRNLQLIEEIVNDTMLVVWRKAPTWDASCKVSTWVFAIAYRKARKAIRTFDEPVDVELDWMEAGPDSQPEQQYARLRQQQAVDAALEALSIEQRTVVQLTYFHEMGYADIADVMGCPANTVKTRMFRARRRLAILLAHRLGVRS
jgi:RNA polymerase sigma-70 factor (ECF subfamily)